jgi:hypothetical protein
MDSEKLREEAIKFADDIEGVENHEICPFLSYQGVLVKCRKDCGIYWRQGRKWPVKGIIEYLNYKRG